MKFYQIFGSYSNCTSHQWHQQTPWKLCQAGNWGITWVKLYCTGDVIQGILRVNWSHRDRNRGDDGGGLISCKHPYELLFFSFIGYFTCNRHTNQQSLRGGSRYAQGSACVNDSSTPAAFLTVSRVLYFRVVNGLSFLTFPENDEPVRARGHSGTALPVSWSTFVTSRSPNLCGRDSERSVCRGTSLIYCLSRRETSHQSEFREEETPDENTIGCMTCR